jgi:hypothetical protein
MTNDYAIVAALAQYPIITIERVIAEYFKKINPNY